jgi:hypothetical protein
LWFSTSGRAKIAERRRLALAAGMSTSMVAGVRRRTA